MEISRSEYFIEWGVQDVRVKGHRCYLPIFTHQIYWMHLYVKLITTGNWQKDTYTTKVVGKIYSWLCRKRDHVIRLWPVLLLLLSHFSHVWLCVTPCTAAYQAPLPMGFSGQEYWSGFPLPSLVTCAFVRELGEKEGCTCGRLPGLAPQMWCPSPGVLHHWGKLSKLIGGPLGQTEQLWEACTPHIKSTLQWTVLGAGWFSTTFSLHAPA